MCRDGESIQELLQYVCYCVSAVLCVLWAVLPDSNKSSSSHHLPVQAPTLL